MKEVIHFTKEEFEAAREGSGWSWGEIRRVYYSRDQRDAYIAQDVSRHHYCDISAKISSNADSCMGNNAIQLLHMSGKVYDWHRPTKAEFPDRFTDAEFGEANEAAVRAGIDPATMDHYVVSEKQNQRDPARVITGMGLGWNPEVTEDEIQISTADYHVLFTWTRPTKLASIPVSEPAEEGPLTVEDFRAAIAASGWSINVLSTAGIAYSEWHKQGCSAWEKVADQTGMHFGARTVPKGVIRVAHRNGDVFDWVRGEDRHEPGDGSGTPRKESDPKAIETTHSAVLQFTDGIIAKVPEPGEGWDLDFEEVVPETDKRGFRAAALVVTSPANFENRVGPVIHEEGIGILHNEYGFRIKCECPEVLTWKRWTRPVPVAEAVKVEFYPGDADGNLPHPPPEYKYADKFPKKHASNKGI